MRHLWLACRVELLALDLPSEGLGIVDGLGVKLLVRQPRPLNPSGVEVVEVEPCVPVDVETVVVRLSYPLGAAQPRARPGGDARRVPPKPHLCESLAHKRCLAARYAGPDDGRLGAAIRQPNIGADGPQHRADEDGEIVAAAARVDERVCGGLPHPGRTHRRAMPERLRAVLGPIAEADSLPLAVQPMLLDSLDHRAHQPRFDRLWEPNHAEQLLEDLLV
mmetsp:Transcript_14858/g.33289  ORF Transcript_14858/g.33289 Transcript_14858/m.33289 type:complete len:220 (-) Transcript_14858:292-951(-)